MMLMMVTSPLPLPLRPRLPLLPQLRLPHPLLLVPASRVLKKLPRLPRHLRLLLRSRTTTRVLSLHRPLLPNLHRPRNNRLPRRQHLFNRQLRRLMLA